MWKIRLPCWVAKIFLVMSRSDTRFSYNSHRPEAQNKMRPQNLLYVIFCVRFDRWCRSINCSCRLCQLLWYRIVSQNKMKYNSASTSNRWTGSSSLSSWHPRLPPTVTVCTCCNFGKNLRVFKTSGHFKCARTHNQIPSAKVQQSDWRQGAECE